MVLWSESIDGAISTQPTNKAEKASFEETTEAPRISGALYPKIHNKLQQAFPICEIRHGP